MKRCVTGDVSKSFIIQLLQLHENHHGNEQAVFIMDNAPIHRQMELRQQFGGALHILMFAPLCSAEMNPVKFLFSNWKHKADMMMIGSELNGWVIENTI